MPHNVDNEKSYDAVIGESLKRLRLERGLTQTQLAAAAAEAGLAFHQQTIDKVERDVRPLRLAEAAVLARVLRVDVASLLSREGDAELISRLREAQVRVEERQAALLDVALALLAEVHVAETVILQGAIDAGHGPMDVRDVELSRPQFREAWAVRQAPERHSTELLKSLSVRPEDVVVRARNAFVEQQEEVKRREARAAEWRTMSTAEKLREVLADSDGDD